MTSLVLAVGLSATLPAAGPPPGYPLPPPQVAPQLPPLPPPALTLDQFSRAFTPVAGTHHVWLVHPKTCQPVEVCFTLPDCGKLRRFEVNRRTIEFVFDRPRAEVEIIFRLNGKVDVKYWD